MKTEFTHDGLMISAQDLSAISPESEDHDRMFHHDGSASISMVGGSSTSQRGYYVWDKDAQGWYALFHNADKLDGKESGAFVHRDGSLPMEADLDLDHFDLVNADSVESGVGRLSLNSNHVTLDALSGGSDVRLRDSNNLLLLNASEGGDVNIPNGALTEQGDRVATRTWTNNNADVSNADYADNANNLDGYDESAFLHVSGDQMEGKLDLGANNVEDGADVLWDAANSEVPQGTLGGPASSLNAYPLGSGDLAEDYAVTSRFPLPAGDLAEDYVLTSRLPLPASDLAEDYAVTSRFPIPNSDLSNSSVTVNAGHQLTGGGGVSLGGSITVDVDENALDADTLDGYHGSEFGALSENENVSGSWDFRSPPVVDENGSGNFEHATTVSFDQGGDNSTYYHNLGQVRSNAGLMHVHGAIGGHTPSQGKAAVDFIVSARDKIITVAHFNGEIGRTDFEVYEDGNGNLNLYAVTNEWAQFSLSLRGVDTNNINEQPSPNTTTPSGTKVYTFSQSADIQVDYDGNLLNHGDRVATRAWTDANADVPNADYADNAGDSDTLDGEHASAFADAGHLHDSRYLLESGDTLSGALTLSDGSEAASRSWVNGNADVPNADYADSAGDSNTLDGLDSSQFLRSDTSDTLNATLSVSGETKVQFGGSNYFARYDSGRDTLVFGSAENGPVAEVDNAGNLSIEGSLTEGATIGN